MKKCVVEKQGWSGGLDIIHLGRFTVSLLNRTVVIKGKRDGTYIVLIRNQGGIQDFVEGLDFYLLLNTQ